MSDLEERAAEFIARGWTRLEGAFTARQAEPFARRARARFRALPPVPRDPRASPMGVTLSAEKSFTIDEFSPRAWDLICRLVGGRERLAEDSFLSWSDAMVIAPPKTSPWLAPAVDGFSWHVDGAQEERRRLDSPSIGLITYLLWDDVAPRGGGTFFAPGALPPLARFLAARPRGVRKVLLPCRDFLTQAPPDFFEFTGKAGTVLITHSLMIHAPSRNASARPRLLGVRGVPLKAPLDLDAPASRRSPVEAATLAALARTPARRR